MPKLKRSRVDRLIAHYRQVPMREAQRLLAANQVTLNGKVLNNRQQVVSYLDDLRVAGQPLSDVEPCYLMLHKPAGVLSATKDPQFQTVLDLVPTQLCCDVKSLHYAGRLDRASTGLMLLTNDGKWSKRIASANSVTDSKAQVEPKAQMQMQMSQVPKYYRVTVANKLKPEDVTAFAQGFYFATEDCWTKPAVLKIISAYQAEVVLVEGRYHQIKRMFARCHNRVLALHRYRIGALSLDIAAGECRTLRPQEIAWF